jgi:CheY-like chemotaxis protein
MTKEVEADRAKSEFVSTVSHELRTPMTAIKGYTDLIHSGMVGEINENQERFLGIIKTNTDRLTALINDLLDISRIETGRVRFEPVSVQLGDIVKTVIDALAPNAESRGHTLTFRVDAGLPEIMADPDRLNQVFTNLVGNAINYTPDGGQISVDVFRVEGAVRVDVKDTGIGIHPGDLSKIFERFYRADHPMVQESRGTGLGLPIVKMFVEMHGGRVWAHSEADSGSTFTVLLPLPTALDEEGLPTMMPETVSLAERRHVLVADDDPDIAELVRLHLEEANYRVTIVGRGEEALEVARRQFPDLIILDILLPDMDGRAVLEALKAEPDTTDIPVLMLTVVMDDGTAFDLGAAGYLSKPIEAKELREAVHVALSRRGRVLVVEDDPDTIEMMRIALRRVGYNVDVAADGYEALTLARRWRPEAIVLDLRLPGMDGYEALTHLKRSLNTQNIPIVVVSAHVADWEAEGKRLLAMGVQSLIPKPFTINQLIDEIDQVVTKVRPLQGKDNVESFD